MNILYITVRSDFGGGPRHIDQLVENLGKQYNIYIAAPVNEPYGIKWKQDLNVKAFFELPYRKLDFISLWELRSFILRNNITVVHSHGNGAGYYSRILKLVCPSIKIIHTFHGISDTYNSKIKKYIHLILGRFFKYFTDEFILVSKGEYDLALKRKFIKEQHSQIIYNGIETPNVTRDYDSNIFNIVTLSRFDYQKNMDYAFTIAERLKDYKDIYFTWVGDGDDYKRLKAAAQQNSLNIVFTGFQTEPMNFLIKSSLYLSTSRFEGLPYALIEAASIGLPILATDVKGNNEVVKNEYNGYLFDNEEECVRLILELYNDRQKLLRFSLNSKSFFKQHFTLNEMLEKLRTVYDRFD